MKAQDMYRVQCELCYALDNDYYASVSTALLIAEDHLNVNQNHKVLLTRITLCTSEEK